MNVYSLCIAENNNMNTPLKCGATVISANIDSTNFKRLIVSTEIKECIKLAEKCKKYYECDNEKKCLKELIIINHITSSAKSYITPLQWIFDKDNNIAFLQKA